MANNYFNFKQFTVLQDKCAFKVGTDGVLLGACAEVKGAAAILDIGTGSGLIALMMAQRSNAELTAIEPDPDSFEQALFNFRSSKWNERIFPVNSDLQNYKPENTRFDLIVSNPPYFAESLKNPYSRKAISRHNETLSNHDLLEGVLRLMAEDGKFQLILPFAEGYIFIAEAALSGLYCSKVIKIKPLPASEVRRLIMTFSRKRSVTKETFLTIEHGKRHEFTDEYKALTKDFYLNF